MKRPRLNRSIRLNISISPDQVREVTRFRESRESNSFPGLSTVYYGTRFSCRLNRNQYNPNGYVEVQKDKTVYFTWERTNKKKDWSSEFQSFNSRNYSGPKMGV